MPQTHTDGSPKVTVSLEADVTFLWEEWEKERRGSPGTQGATEKFHMSKIIHKKVSIGS